MDAYGDLPLHRGDEMTITISWWLIPTIIMIASMIWAYVSSRDNYQSNNFPSFSPAPQFYIAVFVSLIAWAVAGVLK